MSRLLIQTGSVAPRPDFSSFGLEDRAAWSQKQNAVSFFNMLPAAPILGKTQLSASCHHSLNWSTNLGLVSLRALSRGGRSDASSRNNYSETRYVTNMKKKHFPRLPKGQMRSHTGSQVLFLNMCVLKDWLVGGECWHWCTFKEKFTLRSNCWTVAPLSSFPSEMPFTKSRVWNVFSQKQRWRVDQSIAPNSSWNPRQMGQLRSGLVCKRTKKWGMKAAALR